MTKTPKVVAIIQARMGSTRLPGKVLLEAAGLPLILHMLRRVKQCKSLHAIWLATSTNSENDSLQECVEPYGVPVLRGSEDDVLSRYWTIAQREQADWVVRLTGDCPLHDPIIIDQVVQFALTKDFDYVSNSLEATYPDGLDVEVFRSAVLEDAQLNAWSALQREHVTPFIHRYFDGPSPYRVGHYKNDADFSHLRWTLDEARDYEFIKKVFEALYPIKPDFGWMDVLALLTRCPELLSINGEIIRNEGFLKALEAEKNRKSN